MLELGRRSHGPLPRGGVGAPVSNQVSMFGTSDIPLFDMHEIGGTAAGQHGRRTSSARPITYLRNAKTPVLLLHHEGDLRCPIAQSEEIFQALKAMGKEVEFVRYPGGFHRTTRTPHRKRWTTRAGIIDWYASHQPEQREAGSAKAVPARTKAVARR